jgi:predicted small secreted protein
MMKLKKTFGAALLMSGLLVVLSGCQKQEGPAERAGKDIDKATEQAGEKIEQLGEKIQDTAKGDNEDK